MKNKKIIYLDNNSTTATDPKVVDEMLPYFSQCYANANSDSNILSWRAEEAVYNSRVQVSTLINSRVDEVYFTSGATEGNNLIIKGLNWEKGDNIVTSEIEHKCVLESAFLLKRKFGVDTCLLPVQENGTINPAELENKINARTKLVSIMYVNNEIHSINDIERIGKLCKKHKVLFHVDAAQAIGKINIDVAKCEIDFLTISAHKFYGPKGIGAVFVRRGLKEYISPLIHGGGQENNFRSGTSPVPLIVGIGKAAQFSKQAIDDGQELEKIKELTNIFYNQLSAEIPIQLNGQEIGERQLGGLNITLEGIDTGELQFHIPSICYSRGSACSSGSLDYSYVLKAIGLSPQDAVSSLRVCIGKFNTEEEMYIASSEIIQAYKLLRNNSTSLGY